MRATRVGLSDNFKQYGNLVVAKDLTGTRLFFNSVNFRQLRKVVFFEAFNGDYMSVFQGNTLLDAECVRRADFGVNGALAEASLGFEQLSASFIVDARWFFKARRPSWS